jgi:hypothetical protein
MTITQSNLRGASELASHMLWNLPATHFPDRATAYWDVVAQAGLTDRPLDILELGVYRAGLLRGLLERTDIRVASYTGVDPYLGDDRDAYRGAYWKNEREADAVWTSAREVFDAAGHQLHRDFSHEHFARSGKRSWDVIIVDADHRYSAALWDLQHWFKRVKSGGLMLADDYANCDTPEVTPAVNEFIRLNPKAIAKSGYRLLPFQNKGKEVPISLTIVYFLKAEHAGDTKSWSYSLPAKPRVHPVRRLFRRFGLDIRRA